ncbi:MAG TPA: hypothetical protein VHV77_09870 [Pirellulales bacterium]|jgi:hypothetical protein|nr:hypothetical protein [Pirellulales bacterium]
MPRKIYLHIGVEKTGTTSLQHALAANRQVLREHGFLYPETAGSYSHRGLPLCTADASRTLDLQKSANLCDPTRFSEYRREQPALIATEVEQSGCGTIIFSSEHCSSRLRTKDEISALHRMMAPLGSQCRIVIYLRRQDELALSAYSTGLKTGRRSKFSFPNNNKWLEYNRLLGLWGEVFGAENLVVRIFERTSMVDGDLFFDFFSLIGFPAIDQIERPPDKNMRLDALTGEFLRRFNAHVPLYTDTGVNPLRGAIAPALEALSTGPSLRPPAAAAREFLAGFAASNADVARTYLERQDGVLFAEMPPDDEAPEQPILDTKKAIEIAAALWCRQQERIIELQQRIRQMEREKQSRARSGQQQRTLASRAVAGAPARGGGLPVS